MLIDFLARASVAIAATRDERKLPHARFVSGWTIEPDRETLRCLVPAAFATGLPEALEDNRRFVLTAEVIGPHETYQFKGRSVDTSSEITAADRELCRACCDRFVRDVLRLYGHGRFAEEELRARFRPPALVVRSTVDEAYVQTPGPAAGQRLFPSGG